MYNKGSLILKSLLIPLLLPIFTLTAEMPKHSDHDDGSIAFRGGGDRGRGGGNFQRSGQFQHSNFQHRNDFDRHSNLDRNDFNRSDFNRNDLMNRNDFNRRNWDNYSRNYNAAYPYYGDSSYGGYTYPTQTVIYQDSDEDDDTTTYDQYGNPIDGGNYSY